MTKKPEQHPTVQGLTLGASQLLRQMQLKAQGDALKLARTRAQVMQPRRTDLRGLVTVADVLHAAGKVLNATQLKGVQDAAVGLEDVPKEDGEGGGDDRASTAVDRFNDRRNRH